MKRLVFGAALLVSLAVSSVANATVGTVTYIAVGGDYMSVSMGGVNLCTTATDKTVAQFKVGNEGLTSDTFNQIFNLLMQAKLNGVVISLNAGNSNSTTLGRCSGQSVIFTNP